MQRNFLPGILSIPDHYTEVRLPGLLRQAQAAVTCVMHRMREGMFAVAASAALAVTPIVVSAQDLPIVKIFATGGTIANTPEGRIAVEVVLEQVPELSDLADIRIEDITRVASQNLSWNDFIAVANAIERTIEEEPEVDGFIVTIGSNSSEEMAYFLNLVVDTEKPIVVTAAQRQRTTRSEDASRNIIDAVITAGHPDSAGMGAVLVANEMVHAAREVTKNVVSRVDSWQSLGTGALGIISNQQPFYYRAPTRRHTANSEFSLDSIESADDLPKVSILYSYIDADPAIVDFLVHEQGVDGIVVAAWATGSATGAQVDALIAAAEEHGVAVVIGNRGNEGRIGNRASPYISADNLTPQKAHMLLMMGLTQTRDRDELIRIFAEY